MSIETRNHHRGNLGAQPPSALDPPPGRSLGAAMRRHWRWVLAPITGLLALALVVSIVRSPTYTAQTKLAVGGLNATNPASLTGFADAAQQLAQTYSRSVQGGAVVRDVATELHTSPGQVFPHLSAAPIPETPVFSLSATSQSPDMAVSLSMLASQALVHEANRASRANPGLLLKQFQAAEATREQLKRRVDALTTGGGAGLPAARAGLLAARERASSLQSAYETTQAGGVVPLQIIQRPGPASSDRMSVFEILVFAAVVLGLVLGMALAMFRDGPLYYKAVMALERYREGSRFAKSTRELLGRLPSRRRRT